MTRNWQLFLISLFIISSFVIHGCSNELEIIPSTEEIDGTEAENGEIASESSTTQSSNKEVGADEEEPDVDANPVEGWAVLAEKEDYTEEDMHSNPTGYIDNKRIREALLYAGWDESNIHELQEFNRESLQAELDWLEEVADENDIVVLYFSAHSVYLINYLTWNDFFPAEWKQIPSHRRLLIADLCNAGYFTDPIANDPNPNISIASVRGEQLSWKCEESEGLPVVGMIFTKYFVDALKNPSYDADRDGYISVQEAAFIAEEQQRDFMHEYIFSIPDYLKAFQNYGNFPDTDPTFPNMVLHDSIGEPLYLDLKAYR